MQSIVPSRPRFGAIAGRGAHLAMAGLLCTLCCLLASAPAPAASSTSVPISEAPDLEWGVKQSWRSYVGPPSSSGDGAQVIPGGDGGYQVGWKFDAGTYDPADGTTVLRYEGTVHWLKYPATAFPGLKPPSYTGPMDIDILDVSVSDPVVTISAAGSTIAAAVSSRSGKTWEIEHFENARLADLDVGGISPTVAGGTTTWTGIPAEAGVDASAAFSGNYRQGTTFDALSFTYTGPGGAPDVSEHWDEPGSSPLELDANTLLADNGIDLQFEPLLLDRDRRLIYFAQKSDSLGTEVLYQAFSLDGMEALGAPAAKAEGQLVFYDSNSGRLFFRSEEQMEWMRYDAEGEEWQRGVVAQPFPLVGEASGLMWDSAGQRAFNFVRSKPEGVANNDYDNQQWQLNTYEELVDGSWERKTYDVPNGPTGLNRDRYPLFVSSVAAPVGIAAADGSLIVAATRQRSNNPGVPVPAKVPGAFRIVLDEAAGTAAVETIAGTEVDNSLIGVFSQVLSGRGNQVVLTKEDVGDLPAIVQPVAIPGGGAAAVAEPAEVLAGVEADGPTSFAVDREDGTVWIGGNWSQRLTGVRDGRVVASQFFPERHPRGGPVMVGQDHAVYAQTNDGSPADFGGSALYGMGRFARLGVSPEVTLSPAPGSVSLGAGDEAATVSFHSEAGGEPAPARRWQVRAPGAARFAGIAGETGPTLSVEAERGMDGSEYRALYENAAGRTVSDTAVLGVDYAPRVAVDVANVAVVEGSDAEFSVLADGNPAPTVTWQRRVGGFWEAIAPGDDNFLLDGPTLTVLGTNPEQSGALFRAKLVNPVGTAYSRGAKLTVVPSIAVSPGGLDLDQVSLEWTGNAEMQQAPPVGGSNYFSAGVSDGKEDTYSAASGNARIFQVSSTGAETPATYATRAAHVKNGEEQLVRLYGGSGRVEEDGSATIAWDGSFSVNFYGGLVPFTLTDPELAVDEDGAGTLSADLSGCQSSMADPSKCTPMAPWADVTVATFSGVEVAPTGAVEIAPAYAGVEVEVPTGAIAQKRDVAGWGAWPQAFVDFHLATGLAPYWYTSGSPFDPDKAPSPFTVDFAGAAAPDLPPADQAPSPRPFAQPLAPQPSAPAAAKVKPIAVFKLALLSGGRVASIASLSCPAGGPCKVSTPRRIDVRIAGEAYSLRVLAPGWIAAGGEATVRVRLSRAALVALGRGSTTARVPVVLRLPDGPVRAAPRVRIAAAG